MLALTSVPAYDPNAFAAGIDRATWASLNTDKLRPLQNRAIQGRYPPGSTFKIVVATAALEEGVITPDFKVYCPGGGDVLRPLLRVPLPNGAATARWTCATRSRSRATSTSTRSATCSAIDKIHKWAEQLGLGEKTGIDLPNEVQSIVPSTEWKRSDTKNHEQLVRRAKRSRWRSARASCR